MKRKIITIVCVAIVGLNSAMPALAYTKSNTTYYASDPTAVAADALLGRPLCLVATVLGSVVFVVSLPVAATSHSVKPAARALVLTPAWATFKRPLGDFSYAQAGDMEY